MGFLSDIEMVYARRVEDIKNDDWFIGDLWRFDINLFRFIDWPCDISGSLSAGSS